ncbi:MAG: UPF0280 family protein [Pseudomonadota bacterium]
MQGPKAAYLDGTERLHLQHGPIDLIIGAEADQPAARQAAFETAISRFETLLEELVAELPLLRQPLPLAAAPEGFVARRMYQAADLYAAHSFVTPMIAVAGAVADEILDVMTSAVSLRRAYVNNGGDIALHLTPGAQYAAAMISPDGTDLGRIAIEAGTGIGGLATSGRAGRSLSLGIADSVTVAAFDAARADSAATLIANAVDLPEHPGIRREAANQLQPDSDLGARAVVCDVPTLSMDEKAAALARGQACAEAMIRDGTIAGAALFLQQSSEIVGSLSLPNKPVPEMPDV